MTTRKTRLLRKERAKSTTKSAETFGKIKKLKKHWPENLKPYVPKPGHTKLPNIKEPTTNYEEELAKKPFDFDTRLKHKRDEHKREFRDKLSKTMKEDNAQFILYNTKPEETERDPHLIKLTKQIRRHKKNKEEEEEKQDTSSLLSFWSDPTTSSTKKKVISKKGEDFQNTLKNETKKALYKPVTGQSYNPSLSEYKKALEQASEGEYKVFNKLDKILDRLTPKEELLKTRDPNGRRRINKTKRKGLLLAKIQKVRHERKKEMATNNALLHRTSISKMRDNLLQRIEEIIKMKPIREQERLEEKLSTIKRNAVYDANDVFIPKEELIDEAFSEQSTSEDAKHKTLSTSSSLRQMLQNTSEQLWGSVARKLHDQRSFRNKSYMEGNRKVGQYTV
ncbi:hypothetical protein ABK040_009330 [Willaertia magna]